MRCMPFLRKIWTVLPLAARLALLAQSNDKVRSATTALLPALNHACRSSFGSG